jgi:hypothetical protein
MLSAFHLPALSRPPTTTWSYGAGAGAVGLRIPQLTPALLAEQLAALREARAGHLAHRPVEEIVAAIGRAAERLLDRGDPMRRAAESVLPLVTGATPPMVRLVLDRMAADWRADRLRSLLAAEFGDPRVLDSFHPRPMGPGRVRAVGPVLTTQIFSGNVPGVAVTSIIRSLLVKSAVLGKTAVGEPVLPALFARALAEEDAGLGSCVAITYWPGGDEALERQALEAADAVVVYGGREAVEATRARTPASARFVGYGHRLSFGVLAREAVSGRSASESAAQAALAVATFDQQGCVSPHLFYVEEGGSASPAEWAGALASAMRELEVELPRGQLAPGEAAAIRQLRGEVEFAQLGGTGMELHASAEGTGWTVIHDPAPAFEASCLNRVVRVKPVAELMEVVEHARPIAPVLQSVGMAGPAERLAPLADALALLGASRITPLSSLPWPPPTWHHDGSPPLRALVRWCDWET